VALELGADEEEKDEEEKNKIKGGWWIEFP